MIQVERIASLPGHQNPIYAVESSNQPNVFYTAGNDKGVVEWDLDSLSPICVILPVKSSVYALHNPSNSTLLAIGERSGLFTVFDLNTRKIIFSAQHHQLPIFDIKSVASKQEIITASEDGTVAVWSLENFSLLYSFKVSTETVRYIAINEQKGFIAFACKDSRIIIYNLVDYSYFQELSAHAMPVTALQFSPDGALLLSGGRDAKLNIFSTTDFSLRESITAHMFAIYDIKFHPTKPYFATGSRDKSVKIWSSETFKLKKNLSREKGIEAHSLSVNKITWERHTERLITVGDDKMVMIWEISGDE